MAKRTQLRRGTTSEHGAFVGNLGEVTVDTLKKTTVVHDRTTVGGFPTVRENNPTITGDLTLSQTGNSIPEIIFSDDTVIKTAPVYSFYTIFIGTLYTPIYGKRYYPERSIRILNATAYLSEVSNFDINFTIFKNGIEIGTYVLEKNNFKEVYNFAVSIELTINDYISVNVNSGSGSNLSIKFEYLIDFDSPVLGLPSFNITATLDSVLEGSTVQFIINTTNLTNNTQIPYILSGVTQNDLIEGSVSGTITVLNNTASVFYRFRKDLITEGVETATFSLIQNDIAVAEQSTLILDTSIQPLYAGNSDATSTDSTYVNPDYFDSTLADSTSIFNLFYDYQSIDTVTEQDDFYLFYYNPDTADASSREFSIGGLIAGDINHITEEFTVTVESSKFKIRNRTAPTLTFSRSQTFVFNQDDASNNGHPLLFSKTINGTYNSGSIYTTGVKYFLDGVEAADATAYDSGFNSATTRRVQLTVNNAEQDPLFYFSKNSTGYGNASGIPIVGNPNLSDGVFNVFNHVDRVNIELKEDLSTEGVETATFELKNGEGILSLSVLDTSTGTPPTYSLSSNVATVDEGSSVTITLTTTNIVGGSTVPYTVTGITSADLSSGNLTGGFTINNNEGSQTFTLASDNPTEKENLTLSLDNGLATITVPVNDRYRLVAPSSVNEGVNFSVALYTIGISDNTQVAYTITGISSSDLSTGSLTGNFTIQNNQSILNFATAADATTEGNETLTISLDNGADSANITIIDTSKDPTYSLSTNITNVDEGESIVVTLTTTDIVDNTQFDYTITGVSSSDIVGGSLTGTFTVVNNTASVTISIDEDYSTEGAETATVSLDNGEASVSFTINDTSLTPSGTALFDTPGTYTWTVPTGVTSIDVVAIGGGGGGNQAYIINPYSNAAPRSGAGGGGGGLGWANGVSVTPGSTISITVGAAGSGGTTGSTRIADTHSAAGWVLTSSVYNSTIGANSSNGGESNISGTGFSVKGYGGTRGSQQTSGAGGSYFASGGTTRGGSSGGAGAAGNSTVSGGGGGAGGYTGAGGAGSSSLSTASSQTSIDCTSGTFASSGTGGAGGGGGSGYGERYYYYSGGGSFSFDAIYNAGNGGGTGFDQSQGSGAGGKNARLISSAGTNYSPANPWYLCPPTSGSPGSGGTGSLYGGGGGGGTGWRISVCANQNCTSVISEIELRTAGSGGKGAVRIKWGP